MVELPSFPTTDAEIGAALRALRGRRSLRDLEKSAKSTKSSLARYEKGQTPVPHALAKTLDEAYGGRGWIEAAVASVGRGRWEPQMDGQPREHFAHQWPAEYQGLVWVVIKPGISHIGRPHAFQFKWGPWCCELSIVINGTEGTAIVTGKDRDEAAVTCNLTSSPPSHALWGVGEDLGDIEVIDIRQKWFRG